MRLSIDNMVLAKISLSAWGCRKIPKSKAMELAIKFFVDKKFAMMMIRTGARNHGVVENCIVSRSK